MQVLVEEPGGLAKTINRLLALKTLVRTQGNAVRAEEVDTLISGQGTIQEGRFDVVMTKFTGTGGSDGERHTDGRGRRV